MSFSKLKIICIGLLALLLFAPAAGAVYIPGQSTPDDGQYHIMALDDNAASNGVAPSSMDTGIGYSSGIGGSLRTMPLIGQAETAIAVTDPMLSDQKLAINNGETAMPPMPLVSLPPRSNTEKGAPAIIAPPSPLRLNMGETSYPITTIPSAGSDGNIYMGSVIGHITTPPTPGYWDNVDPASLHTNMPMLNSPIVFA